MKTRTPLKHRICGLFRHPWRSTAEAKRFCPRCGREEWLFSREFPRIGQPKYFWKEMPFDRLEF